jgi:hypothetical protein
MNSSPSPEDALAAERRAAVAEAVKARMAELRLSVHGLSKLSGLAVNTIKGVITTTGTPTTGTLVVLSAVLEWDPQHLLNIVSGRADANVTRESLLAALLAKLGTEEAGLRAAIAALTDDVRRVDAKIDILAELVTRRDSPDQRRHR